MPTYGDLVVQIYHTVSMGKLWVAFLHTSNPYTVLHALMKDIHLMTPSTMIVSPMTLEGIV